MRKRQPSANYSLQEYAAMEHTSDRRFEYRDGEIVSISGGTLAHYRIEGNLFRAIDSKLDPRCQVFTSSAAVKSPALLTHCYPDLTIVCGVISIKKVLGIDAITNPMIIFEVLSPDSADYDRNDKRKIYQAIPTLIEYLLVAQDSAHIVHYVKQGDLWQRTEAAGLDASLELSSIEVVLPFDEIYRGVSFE
jgi:Uma2 family endonuclease